MSYSSRTLALQRLRARQDSEKRTQQRLWHQFSIQACLSNEWTVSAQLGEPAFTDEQAHMIACLFGRC